MKNNEIDFLTSLALNDSIILNVSAENWQDAISQCFLPLLAKDCIEERYVKAVIKSTKKYGPYYIICPRVAMPHSRPEDGVKKNAFSLITLKEPVIFEDQAISLLIGFCATDANVHLQMALPQIVAVFEQQEVIDKLLNAVNVTEIKNIIKTIDYSKYLPN